MKKMIVSITVLLHFTALVHGAAFPGGSSDTSAPAEFPSLQSLALRALITQPGELVQYDKKLTELYPNEKQPLFIESVQRALGSRLGWNAFSSHPELPIVERIFPEELLVGFNPDVSNAFFLEHDVKDSKSYKRNIYSGDLVSRFDEEEPVRLSSADNPVFSQGFDNDARAMYVAINDNLYRFFNESLKGLSSDGRILVTVKNARDTVLREINFRPDLATITDPEQQKLLLTAVQDWLEKKPHGVDSHDPVYLSVIANFKYLNNPLLFDPIETPQATYDRLRAELDRSLRRAQNQQDQQFKDLVKKTAGAWINVQKLQGETVIKSLDFFQMFPIGSPVWSVFYDLVYAALPPINN